MLPPPTLVFTIPSIHDDTILDCRVYHPLRLNPDSVSQVSSPWEKKAAVVAHPYAPLGGCYDDPVVDVVATTILKQGFVVGTFNFRGAGSSQGRTSWTSKPEQNDYISMIGFMMYYMHHLSSPALRSVPLDHLQSSALDYDDHRLTPIPSQALPPEQFATPTFPAGPRSSSPREEPYTSTDSPLTLLIAGYSYGSLIATCIPPISRASVLPLFSTPMRGSPHAEIRLRAHTLATQQNDLLHTQFLAILSQRPVSYSQSRGRSLKIKENMVGSPSGIPKANRGVRMGGEEDLRRASYESYRSRSSFTLDTPERIRKSVDRMRSITRPNRFPQRRRNSNGSYASSKAMGSEFSLDADKPDVAEPTESDKMEQVLGIGNNLKTAYLLVSPPQGIVGNLATMWSSKAKLAKGKEKETITEDEMKFINNPTLTIFCHDDGLISVKKLKSWAEKLANVRGAKFKYKAVTGGGHFWHDHNALHTLRQEIKVFVENI